MDFIGDFWLAVLLEKVVLQNNKLLILIIIFYGMASLIKPNFKGNITLMSREITSQVGRNQADWF